MQKESAWSRNSAKYLALMGDFALLQKQIEAIPGPGLRYSSELLPYVPDHSVVYAAIPNLSATLGEASQLFQERLQQSPALRSWWKEQQRGKGPKVGDVIQRLQTFSSYLGDEIVFAVSKDGTTYSSPVVLAKVRQPGLGPFLKSEMKRLNANRTENALQIVRDPWATSSLPGRPFLVYVNNDMFVATPDVAEVRRVLALAQQSVTRHFSCTPLH